ncbi:helix-turn-helix domain-containing protein [Pseudomonas sp. SC11]|uniref:helix-turn-helix domain-containing protein n=1 Tax=Pseudomonas sp. SC11 TaxID=326927 RepID=UPI00399B5CE4
MAVGIRLKEERLRLGLNQTAMAAVGGVGKTTQINYEKGSGAPDAFYLSAVGDLGVDVLYVVTGARKPLLANSLSAVEADLLQHFRRLPDGEQGYVGRMIAALASDLSSPTGK